MAGWLSGAARKLIEAEYLANLEAVRHARMSDWAAYQKIVGWLDGVEAALRAIEDAEHKAGIGESGGFGP